MQEYRHSSSGIQALPTNKKILLRFNADNVLMCGIYLCVADYPLVTNFYANLKHDLVTFNSLLALTLKRFFYNKNRSLIVFVSNYSAALASSVNPISRF